ncbi:transcription factor HES-1-like isoform X1 [Fopius arisanus]|uniref:Transcription factor HES-1-like isoform X1 n=1 Tax=Fopius arisanus TaxID=64838 RepID=A0A9R1UA04_9HYME|nr:PREDICTED: transcription factor HES-1-like isoform X1 [Fopius arisanus]XP_011312626.1 PREDICTED: transcription factor HES-1-like isoform X1 [Fopius arisanus]XP_011312627.1 PREDICTED: transcription factor HES-1-like isoform X1 [Fopius arisanus]XP_011312628.1 PREDICTED: transcription factor HES-1-like isoform X1 [Fopius arisanus]XP_011312629.1 PREDICTED: transcription factor HES-1-like isoform X1 [Fopius arisanus]XP_011312630.1 PREDICTED: transcription factor HES-1-like isoform X1 [Fopius ari
MEKRRRARINQSLAALKALILDSARLENTKHSKLEKADILELTVRHLQRQRSLTQPGLSRYKAGYHDCSREVSRYLEAPDIITGNTSSMEPAIKQRLLRHLDSCVSELDLDLGSRPDSAIGSSSGSMADRISGTTSPSAREQYTLAAPQCSSSSNPVLMKSEVADQESTRPDSSTTAGDENNNSSRPSSALTQVNLATLDSHLSGNIMVDQASTSNQNPSMLSVVQVIPSRLPDGQVVFLLPSHYVQLAAAAAANGINIGPNAPTAIWAATNMSLLKNTEKLQKRSHEDISQGWIPDGSKAAKSPKIELSEQPLDFTTTSKKLKGRLEHQAQTVLIIHNGRSPSNGGSEEDMSMSTIRQHSIKDEEEMWRPW